MENKDLQLELDLLLTDRFLSGFFNGQKCIDWAISLMQRGYQSENLYILAGLDSNDGISIELYLGKLIDDFGLCGNRDKEELFKLYISSIAHQVIDEQIEPLKGLGMIESKITQSFEMNFSTKKLNQFLYLSEDISLVDDYQLFYIGLTKKNIDEVIIDEMKMFLIAISTDFTDISSLIYCLDCKGFSHSKYEDKEGLLKKSGWYCEKCNSTKYLAWYNIADRKQILMMLKNYEKGI